MNPQVTMETLQLKRFDCSQIKPFSAVLVTGEHLADRTAIIEELVNQLRGDGSVHIFSASENWLSHYSLADDDKTYLDFQLGQSICYSAENIMSLIQSGQVTFIFDNLDWTEMWRAHTWFRDLCFNARWKHCNVIISSPAVNLPIAMRTAFDYTVHGFMSSFYMREKIYRVFGGIFPTLGEFKRVFQTITSKPFHYMVIDQRAHSYDITSHIFWYDCKV